MATLDHLLIAWIIASEAVGLGMRGALRGTRGLPCRSPAMPKPKAPKIVVSKPVKVGLATQLAAIQHRYRRAMLAVYDHPPAAQSGLIRAALDTLLAEKAALGVRDGEEAAEG